MALISPEELVVKDHVARTLGVYCGQTFEVDMLILKAHRLGRAEGIFWDERNAPRKKRFQRTRVIVWSAFVHQQWRLYLKCARALNHQFKRFQNYKIFPIMRTRAANTTCKRYELLRLTVKQKIVHRNVPSKESVLERRTCEPKIAESTRF
ncbi:hypothetical protein EVAR_92395_1 [Eumeta japonica]|uniref:Uncharacterized protein n=1 Tax=Eumeta variegata TaxID=151549 RepID=A0A4C1TIN5_EUMVA|nr:hypothetical protein EVAR_92395_1 [Eumeta japonica]